MSRPATPTDIARILSRLRKLPRLGKPLRSDPTLIRRLRWHAQMSVEKLASPRSEIEMSLRAELRELRH